MACKIIMHVKSGLTVNALYNDMLDLEGFLVLLRMQGLTRDCDRDSCVLILIPLLHAL
jgi:hypothetical protein